MEGRIVFERLNEDGEVIERTFGSSQQERLDDHNNGKCDWLCPYCYDEACKWLDEQEDKDQQTDYKISLKNDY